MGRRDEPATGDHSHDHPGGYAERGPGRGDHPGRGRGSSRDAQSRKDPGEREAEGHSRWRDEEPDARSERWEDGEEGDASNPD